MTLNDLEKDLRNAKLHHLTEGELDSYLDQGLDDIGLARAEAHLKLCFICEQRLEVLKEEGLALKDRQVSAEDIALVKRQMKQIGFQQQSSAPSSTDASTGPSITDRLAEHLRQMVKSWQAHFLPLTPARSAGDEGEELWQWQSEDGTLNARAILEDTGDLTIHFTSRELNWEGTSLRVSLGEVSRETTLRRVSESELYASVEIPRTQLAIDLTDISIETT
jgi:hypothetical protein